MALARHTSKYYFSQFLQRLKSNINFRTKAFVIYPNYAAKKFKNYIQLESSHPLLLDAITSYRSPICIAAMVDITDRSGAYKILSNQEVKLINIGYVRKKSEQNHSLLDYFTMIPMIFKTVFNSYFNYIFIPGHIGLITCIFCIILNRPYAIYLRGNWKILSPKFNWIRHLIINKAKFVLFTGSKIPKEISRNNPICESVIPMSELILNKVIPRESFCTNKILNLLFVGELLKGKGIYDLVNAMAKLRERGFSNIKLSIVGTGIEWNNLHDLVTQSGLLDYISFLGYVDNTITLSELYYDSDVFCLPTYSEGFPRVIYEAMLYSLPIITTPVGQIESLLIDNINGLFVEVGNVEDITEKIISLYVNNELRKRLGKQARLTIEPMLQSWRESTHGHQVIRLMKSSKII